MTKNIKTLGFQNGVGFFSTTACGGRNNSCRRFYGARQAGAAGEESVPGMRGDHKSDQRRAPKSRKHLHHRLATGEMETHEDFCSCTLSSLTSLLLSTCPFLLMEIPLHTYSPCVPLCSSCVWLLIDSTDPHVLSVTHKEGWKVKWLHRGFTSIIRI